MEVNPVSQQSIATQSVQSAPSSPKSAATMVSQELAQKTDNVVLSEKAKDLAAQQAGKGAAEELNESASAKQREALSQAAN